MREAEQFIMRIDTLEKEIKESVELNKFKEAELKKLKEQDFPIFLLENGLRKYEATDGTKVSYSSACHASTSSERRPEAVKILGKYGLASAFKYELKLQFPLTSGGAVEHNDLLETIKELFHANNLSFNEDFVVHYKTLEKAAEDLLNVVAPEDVERAREVLAITDYYRTTITKTKKEK